MTEHTYPEFLRIPRDEFLKKDYFQSHLFQLFLLRVGSVQRWHAQNSVPGNVADTSTQRAADSVSVTPQRLVLDSAQVNQQEPSSATPTLAKKQGAIRARPLCAFQLGPATVFIKRLP